MRKTLTITIEAKEDFVIITSHVFELVKNVIDQVQNISKFIVEEK